jgi:type VI secretion system protein ImpB
LRDLLAKLDGNDELDSMLERIVQNSEELKKLKSQAYVGDAPAAAAPQASAATPTTEDTPSE